MRQHTPIVLGTAQGELERAVHLFDLFVQARLSVSGDIQEVARAETSLALMFGTIVSGYVEQRTPRIASRLTLAEQNPVLQELLVPLPAKTPEKIPVTQTWHNFLTAVSQDQPQAFRILNIMWTLYGMKSGAEFVRLSEWTIPDHITMLLDTIGNMEPVLLPVPDHLYDSVSPKTSEITQRLMDEQAKVVTIVEWFSRERDSFLQRRDAMWAEISTEPKFGLRTDGRDRIRMNFGALEMSIWRYEALQLFPVNPFPRARAKYWIRLHEFPYSLTFTLDPKQSQMDKNHPRSTDSTEGMRHLVDEMLECIALDCYWRIVTGNTQTGQASNVSTTTPQQGEVRRGRSLHTVRPFFRTLPRGFQPSPQALALAQKVLGTPPPGRTFVKEHERGFQQAANIPPLFTYTEIDLGYRE